MPIGLRFAAGLAPALRPSYAQGDLNVRTLYLVEGLRLGQHRILVKPEFETACWVPPVGKQWAHSIYYGDRMLVRVLDWFVKTNHIQIPTTLTGSGLEPKPAVSPRRAAFEAQVDWLSTHLTSEQNEKLRGMCTSAVAAYGRHERCHAQHTSPGLKEVEAELKSLKIPFQYFNLFEDARIESLSRRELGTNFGWVHIEELAETKTPVELFLRCIQLEGEPDVALGSTEPVGTDSPRTLGEVAGAVREYYKRACACTQDRHLFPIIQEFLDEFKPEQSDPDKEPGEGGESGAGEPGTGTGTGTSSKSGESGAGERAGDLSFAAEAAEKGGAFFSEFDEEAELVRGTDVESAAAEAKAKASAGSDKGRPSKGIPNSIAPQASGGRATPCDFLANQPGVLDDLYQKRVESLVARVLRMCVAHTFPAATEAPGQRMSGRHLARGEIRYLHKKVYGKAKRRYSIVYDCSGSMTGYPDREGKLLLLALNEVARRGYLAGSLVLSGWVGGRPGWLSYAFPVADEVILSIVPNHQSEGLQAAITDNLRVLRDVDDLFVYTDARICDAPIDRVFLAGKRVWPVGLYAGNNSASAAEMERHFPQNIVKPTIEEIVETMLTRNRRTCS